MKKISSLLCGLLFGLGLAASGMTNTAKVIGFLDVWGNWDPDLLFVMGYAVITTLIGFHFISKLKTPIFTEQFSVVVNSQIDSKLIFGALIFGLGWGLYGYCPGPAVASIVYLQPATGIFILAMLVGMKVGHILENRLSN